MKKIMLFVAVMMLLTPHVVMAQDGQPSGDIVKGFRTTDLPLPRYVSLRSEKTYVRTGPALRYPIKWVYKQKSMPVEIIQEFEAWRKVRDYEGDTGWIHQSLLTGERTVLVNNAEPIAVREGFSEDARMVARFEPLVIANLEKCTENWCEIEAKGYEGWAERKYLWGVYDSEKLD